MVSVTPIGRAGTQRTPPIRWSRGALWSALFGAVLFGALFPFAMFYFMLLLVAFTSGIHSPRREIVFLLCVGAIAVLGPLLALKLPLDNGGNDKIQYLDFMRTMGASGIVKYLIAQPELLSFSSLYVAWALFGSTDLAFLFVFALYFSLLLFAVWRIEHRAIPLFIMLLTSSAAFYASYGNVIRQSMAFPFLFLLISSQHGKRRFLFLVLAGFAHIPSLLITAPYLAYRMFGKWVVWVSGLIATAILFISGRNMRVFGAFSGDDGYLSKKINLYSTWDAYSVATVAAMATGIFLINNLVWRRMRRKAALSPGSSVDRVLEALLVASNFAFMGMFATYNLAKVFERIYIYFFVISLAHLSIVIARSRSGPTKTLVILGALAYSVYGLLKNLEIQDLLFGGHPIGYLTASFLDLYRSFL
ncbi:EpsG family protein [Paraburkholderia sediminicola]|uniref:EpsG family protein n=1 Tax=Paraburkholderia sediminicola TaxID=458836 RepID=UPI0038B942EF